MRKRELPGTTRVASSDESFIVANIITTLLCAFYFARSRHTTFFIMI